VRGGCGANESSARAPSETIDHGTPRSARTDCTPSTKRSRSPNISSNASAVSTSNSVARAAASDSALPASVPPTPPTSTRSASSSAAMRAESSALTP